MVFDGPPMFNNTIAVPFDLSLCAGVVGATVASDRALKKPEESRELVSAWESFRECLMDDIGIGRGRIERRRRRVKWWRCWRGRFACWPELQPHAGERSLLTDGRDDPGAHAFAVH